MEAEVSDNPDEERFEIRVAGKLAGHADYKRRPGLIAFIHTEIDESYGGQGLGGTLVAAALDSTRAAGLDVLPFCPFVNRYIGQHPEYTDLVPAAERARFGLEPTNANQEET